MRTSVAISPLSALVALTSALLVPHLAEAQLVALRHPETANDAVRPLLIRGPSRPAHTAAAATTATTTQVRGPFSNERQPPRTRHTARPGDVIVHFNKNHEISELRYVLSDGQLATLYDKSANNNSSQPSPQAGNEPLQERPPPPTMEAPAEQPNNSADQSIDIVDAKLRGVAQLVGDNHVTIELPGVNEKLGVLATVAGADQASPDQVQQVGGAPPKLRLGAAKLLGKLRAKVTSKLRDLPNLIAQKLRGKSSAFGQVLFESRNEAPAASGYVNPTALSQPIVVPAPPTMHLPPPGASQLNVQQQAQQQQQQQQLEIAQQEQQQVVDDGESGSRRSLEPIRRTERVS